jgi:hypothetical protein
MFLKGSFLDRVNLELSFQFEEVFYLLLYCGLSLSCMIILIESFEAWGPLYALIILLVAGISAGIFWKVQSHFVRSYRSGLLLVMILLLAYSTWILAGTLTHELSANLLAVPITVGVFALLVACLFAVSSWFKILFVKECNLLPRDLAKWGFNLPESVQTPNVLDIYGSMARISNLFANNEYSLVISVVGSSIEGLLREIYPEKNAGIGTMVKSLCLDVRYENSKLIGKEHFTVMYFWHNVRSKYAHSSGVETLGAKRFYAFNVLKEPSKETAKKSIGLLGVFLKEYLNVIKNPNLLNNSDKVT